MQTEIGLGEKLDIMIGERKCASMLEDITDAGTLIISHPTYKSIPMPLLSTESVQVVYYRASGMFSFVASALRHFKDERGIALMELQIKSPVSRYQRRDFVRFDCTYRLDVRVIASAEQVTRDSVENILSGMTEWLVFGGTPPAGMETTAENCAGIDISGGGLCFSGTRSYEKDTLLECALHLPRLAPMTMNVLVIRTIYVPGGDPPRVSCRFVGISEDERRVITKYIFDEQVKQKRR